MMFTHHGGGQLRTTLTIDDDILSAARELATMERCSVGEVVSTLVRKALRNSSSEISEISETKSRTGIPLLPNRDGAPPVTSEMVKQLADELF